MLSTVKDQWGRLKDFTNECIRVMKVIKKPDKEEYTTIVKVTSLGIAIIGFVGLVIQMINQLFIT